MSSLVTDYCSFKDENRMHKLIVSSFTQALMTARLKMVCVDLQMLMAMTLIGRRDWVRLPAVGLDPSLITQPFALVRLL